MRRTFRQPARAGFTLIELLVVITIIAVLVGLLAAGVQAARGTALRTQAKADINEFNSVLSGFTQKYTTGRPLPSKAVLCENINDYLPGGAFANNPDAQFTFVALTEIFGPRVMAANVTVDWNGDGSFAAPGTAYTLEGEEALVFWTGGIPSPPGQIPACLGFNLSYNNPAVNPQKLPFNFTLSRLVRSPNPNAPNFLRYNDPYGIPYAYFATHGSQNQYQNDCPLLVGNAFTPYQTASNQFVNPSGFQILSAGADKNFGVGGLWSPTTGIQGHDFDNLSNFSSSMIGGGQ
jgi:prepilin-type N-terminal cleavage/methylation domain-containing protein